MNFDWTLARGSLDPLLHGLLTTVVLTIVVGISSLVFGVFVALVRRPSAPVPIRMVANGYVQVVRATPMLIQLIYIYYALPFLGVSLNAFVAGYIGLTLNVSAYLAEVYRGGIEAVPQDQWDAAAALGMKPQVVMARVILPQAFRIVVPSLGNYMVSLFKDTSLVSVITVQDLLFSAQIYAAKSYDYITVYTVVFVMYFAVGYPAIRLVMLLERRLSSGYARRRGGGGAPTAGDPMAPVGVLEVQP